MPHLFSEKIKPYFKVLYLFFCNGILLIFYLLLTFFRLVITQRYRLRDAQEICLVWIDPNHGKYLNALRQSLNDCNDGQPLARYPKEESVSLTTLPMSSACNFEQVSAMIFKEESVNFLK